MGKPSADRRAGFYLDWDLRMALTLGSVSVWVPHYSEDELRTAWELFGDELLAELDPCMRPGDRPWAFWNFTAGRSQNVLPTPPFTGLPPDEYAARLDECAVEPILFLDEHGYLSDAERDELLRRADEARDRIGTAAQRGQLRTADDGERVWCGGDRTAVAIGEALELGAPYHPDGKLTTEENMQ